MIAPVLPTYNRADVAFVRGEGAYMFDEAGNRYLDFGAGVAVNSLGHAHPHLVETIREQAGKLWHTSNVFRIPAQERLAKRLVDATFADTVFFCNSGGEAIECSIKMARKYHSANGQPERFRIITFEGAFHGRTLAGIAAAGAKKNLEGFGPPTDGFDNVPFGDMDAVVKAAGPETGAILIEPIQGEVGIRPAPPGFLKRLREFCDQHGMLLIFDEVQTGVGRTGQLFAYQTYGVTPDIMAIAKGIGGGFPIGACLATEKAAKGMVTGSHGSTFGGNPLGTAVANAVLDVVLAPEFLEHVRRTASSFQQMLAGLAAEHPNVIAGVRGEGLMIGLMLHVPVGAFLERLRGNRMIAIGSAENAIRILPPLIIEEAQLKEAIAALSQTCLSFEAERKAG